MHKVEIAALRLQLINKESNEQSNSVRRVTKEPSRSGLIGESMKSVMTMVLSRLEVIKEEVAEYSGSVGELNGKVSAIKSTLAFGRERSCLAQDELRKLKEEREKIYIDNKLSVEHIEELKGECQKQVKNVKKSIQECRRLQGERTRLLEENELLRNKVKVLESQLSTNNH
eukprot:TRINITY_DN8377_c0_g1_i4.p2 TRINITY_DN8377_c0_g1~~TRINITY_DN8377_c0_g1_i4.p2  ORF type:complete len:171 (-),score=39.90 TRINITY_DN8377_c0_g1_i4:36-548(-)